MRKNINFNYYPLKGFIYSNPKLENVKGFAAFLGIRQPSLFNKMCNRAKFSQDEIYKTMVAFDLTPQQIVDFFFTPEESE